MNKRPTQAQRILQYLEEYGSITPLQAMRDLGCYRLASRIFELKEANHPIERKFVTVWNRYGEETQIASYSIAQPKTDDDAV